MRAYYTADRVKFFNDSDDQILGELARVHNFALDIEQKGAWLQQISILRGALKALDDFTIYFEFSIPRMGKRADAVVVIGNCIFVLEFKVGSEQFDRAAIEQVEDYALDLKNFHEGSHNLSIVPILIPTRALTSPDTQLELAMDQVAKPVMAAVPDLGAIIRMFSVHHKAQVFDATAWAASGYRPTPTIVEAARALYARHEVADITRSDAGAINLNQTQGVIGSVIEDAKARGRKSICFVTGVPGAGKTLAGLNIATQRSETHADEHATFLSGNGPLVDVLREALTRDQASRTGQSKTHVERKVRAFIQKSIISAMTMPSRPLYPASMLWCLMKPNAPGTRRRQPVLCSKSAASSILTCLSRNSCSVSWIVTKTGARWSA